MEGAIFIALCICAWKLWQIEKWLRRLRVNSLTPAATVTSQSTETRVQPDLKEQPPRGSGTKNDPLVVSPEEYRRMVGLK